MINIDHDGRVCLVSGNPYGLLVSIILGVRVGTQPVNEYLQRYDSDGNPGTNVPDGYRFYRMTPGMTYNILRAAEKFSRTLTDRTLASVMVDHERRSWVGRPGEWRPIGEQTPTVWARLLADELVGG